MNLGNLCPSLIVARSLSLMTLPFASMRFLSVMNLARLFLLLTVVVFLSGCAFEKSSRAITAENIANAHATTIDRTIEGERIPNVTVSGSSNTVTIGTPATMSRLTVNDSADTKGTATGDFTSKTKANVSMWIAIALACLCLGLLLIAYVFFSRATATGMAADKGIAASIDTVATLAAHSTSTEVISALTSVRADLEKRRGSLNR